MPDICRAHGCGDRVWQWQRWTHRVYASLGEWQRWSHRVYASLGDSYSKFKQHTSASTRLSGQLGFAATTRRAASQAALSRSPTSCTGSTPCSFPRFASSSPSTAWLGCVMSVIPVRQLLCTSHCDRPSSVPTSSSTWLLCCCLDQAVGGHAAYHTHHTSASMNVMFIMLCNHPCLSYCHRED